MEVKKIHISKGNTKLGNIPNWSLTPGKTCSKVACNTCLKEGCYAMKAYRMYPSVKKAWDENTIFAMGEQIDLLNELIKYFEKFKGQYFRIHQAGDFVSVKYFSVWVAIAILFPNIQFMAYTKQFDILAEYGYKYGFAKIPDNFKIYLSAWTDYVPPSGLRKYFPVAWLAEDMVECSRIGGFVCPGSCVECKHCYNKNTKDVIFIKH